MELPLRYGTGPKKYSDDFKVSFLLCASSLEDFSYII